MFPVETTDDPVQRRVVERIGSRPIDAEVEAALLVINLEMMILSGGGRQARSPYTTSKTIVRYAGRDMVIVYEESGVTRTFYKRLGLGGPDEGWAKKGSWVEHHGIAKYMEMNEGKLYTKEWVIKPQGSRMGGAGSKNISDFLQKELAGGYKTLTVEDAKVINAWLRFNNVEVGGGYSIGSTPPFDPRAVISDIP